MTATLALFAWAVSALLMTLLWLWQRRTGNAGVVDVAWSFATAVTGVAFALVLGEGPRSSIIAGIAGLWGARLGLHLWKRMSSDTLEDARYRAMREAWGPRFQARMFGFYQLQALWAVLFALPMAWAAWNRSPLGWLDGLGVLIWLAAFAGEAAADRQLERFRRAAGAAGRVCDQGLWRYSRHPNYFFEWTQWFAYVALAAGGDGRWLAWLGPAVMLLFLLKLTGIPPLEQRMLASRGEAYRAYQRRTSVFVPWPPRHGER
jgi:steroid 5-alpha reductase family enzyme